MFTQFFSGEVTITKDSLHYSIYYWWRKHRTGFIARPHDFCSYCRVVFLWAPLLWFFRAPVFGWVRPWMMSGVAMPPRDRTF